MKTNRDAAEAVLLAEFPQVRPLTPAEASTIEKYKDGSFGLSTLGFALYSNGNNLRGKSSNHPYGLIFEDGETLFSIGHFRKELDSPASEGHLLIVAPRGKDAIEKVKKFSEKTLEKTSCASVYARFLTLNQYLGLLNKGFLPIEESPWHGDSPKEDETCLNSLLKLNDVFDESGQVKKLATGTAKTRDRTRRSYNDFKKLNLSYSLEPYTEAKYQEAKLIVDAHFQEKKDRIIGSTAEDHYNSIDPAFCNLPATVAYVGYLEDKPVSIFVGEKVSPNRVALYTPITLQPSSSKLLERVLARAAYVELFSLLKAQGIKEVHLGGSEHRELNRLKREFGCRNDPSYWAVKMR